MRPELILTDRHDPEATAAILDRLVAFNEAAAGPSGFRPLQVQVRDPATGEVVGGLTGRTSYGWLFVEHLFVPGSLRGSGIGSELMARAEAEARARGCVGVWLDTFAFQARGFYERLGYRVFGTIEGYPPGHARFFLEKRLAGPADGDAPDLTRPG